VYPLPSAREIGGGGGIYGIVSEDGVALPNRPVYLFERDTFYRVGFTTTNEYGGYAFSGLNTEREFTVMSVDPSGPPYKNALIWDRIRPINARASLTPQSAFWARRCRDASLGSLVSFAGYVQGGVYRWLKTNILGSCETTYYTGNQSLWGFDFYPDTLVGGSLLFLKSPRYRPVSPQNLGLILHTGHGCFNGLNTAGNSSNYQRLTFEYIIKVPQSGEGSLIIAWSGSRDSDDASFLTGENYTGYACGPTLEVTTTTLNVRIPLGTNNLSTVRATASVVSGALYHVMVTFEQDVELKLYMNGVLAQTTAITATGRIFGWNKGHYQYNYQIGYEDWNYTYSAGESRLSAIRRFMYCTITGTGGKTDNTGAAGFGGGIALAAMYGRVFSLLDVQNFYDSMVNWESHVVPVTYSGYVGEVEADNPAYYFRLNELSSVRGVVSWLGAKDTLSVFEGTPGFNATGFTTGTGALTTSNGGVVLLGSSPIIQSIFTFEVFIRPSASGTYRLLLSRVYNSSTYVYISLVSGVLSLTLIDHGGTTTTLTCPGTLSVGTAYHIAISYDPYVSKLCKFIINGVTVSTQTATAVPDIVSKAISWTGIGVNPTGTAPSYSERFQGQMGELAIYNYEVPEARIAAHYAARNT
jgi:hypothetical protein